MSIERIYMYIVKGTSSSDGKKETAEWIIEKDIRTVLDVGAGSGTYAKLLEDNFIMVEKIDAIEIWEPYIEYNDLRSKYSNVFSDDVRNWNDFNYDLVILGDVLEHMTKEEAMSVWSRVSQMAKHAIISIPIINYPQGHEHGNPYEEHVKEDWSTDEVLKTFAGIINHEEYSVVGVFYATF